MGRQISKLAGPVDAERIAVGGHSIAGAVAFQVAITDPRVHAVFDLDGWLHGPALTTPVKVPALMVNASGLEPNTSAVIARTPNAVTVKLAGATHGDVTDLPCIAPALGPMAKRARPRHHRPYRHDDIDCTRPPIPRHCPQARRSHTDGEPAQFQSARRGMTLDGPATRLTTKGQTMKAILQDKYGTPDKLHLGDTDQPVPGPNEVLVQVHAAGIDRGTAHLMRGEPYLMRVIGFGFRGPKNPVPGRDVAGTIVQIGSDVTDFKPGDEVFGIAPKGSFAEYAVAPTKKLVHKPARLTFEQAAVVPVSATTAMQALRDVGHVKPGQHVLIIGASGGVGTYAVQLAKALGATVTGVSSTAKVDLVRSLGADDVIDYTKRTSPSVRRATT